MVISVLLLLGMPFVFARTKTERALNERSFHGDPRRNITCLGKHYDLQLPLRRDGHDPNELTMQQLCAKTEYGGAPNGSHFGEWCSRGLQSISKDDPPEPEPDLEDVLDDGRTRDFNDETGVSFDHSPYGGADLELGDPRFLLGFFNRCFCNYGVTDLTIQPKRDEPSDADVHKSYSDSTGEISLDVTDVSGLTTAEDEDNGHLGDVKVEAVELTELVEPNEQEGFALEIVQDQPWSLSLDAGNYITCEGDLPTFPLPEPYPVSEF